jgi:phenylpropionate dioxygenase-like ring-hydroxylating dioxygenase large terminal subunit
VTIVEPECVESIDVLSAEQQIESLKPDLRKTGIHPNYWYPLARSKDLKSGKLLGVAFAGEPIVLVRTVSGLLYALEDRCAHRQVPLNAGQVTGDLLQCGYHCWTYNKTGRCVSIPYLDKDKKVPNGVRSYPCHEAYGLIFVYPGDIQSLSEATFPDIPSFFNGR